jgi:hypothetical protein
LGLHLKAKRLADSGIIQAKTPSLGYQKIQDSSGMQTCETTSLLDSNISARRMNREQLMRLAVVLSICDPLPQKFLGMLPLSNNAWARLLRWLDMSGLSLYFLNRLLELDLCDVLPPAVLTRLLQNQIDNTKRTRSMISESIAIQQEFQKAGLIYSNLKGLTLCPDSVPKPELRLQFDLDFLVAESCAPIARAILEDRGYRLYAISGRSWEFKFNERPGIALRDIYKDMKSYAVELHLESGVPHKRSTFEQLEWQERCGMCMPVLSAVDLFLGQGLHVFKHICGESSRAAHLLEFRQHVLTRRDDHAFWNELQLAAGGNPQASHGLGVVILLITLIIGDFAPEALTAWTVDALSKPVRLWVEIYGHRVALGSYPGSKLYLLLRKELEPEGSQQGRSLRRALLPSRLPPPVIRAFPNEAAPVRFRRYSMHLRLILERLRFHIVEGVRFTLESRRWRRMKELAQ